jgi:hypothetical protein
MVQPATGATERLPDAAGGPRCSACGTRNSPGAQFCVMCGRPLAAAVAPPAPVAPAVPVAAPTVPALVEPSPLSAAPARTRPRNPAVWGGVSGGLFLISLAVLALTGWWWPGILVLLGIVALGSSLANGQPWAGLQGALWLFGIAFIAQFNLWWPGILILVGLSAILGALWRPRR